jgi:hypothetical protein
VTPVTASSATSVCERLCVSTPITIICTVPSFGENGPTERISGGHTSVGAMPRSYEVTPKVLGWRRATRLKPVRPNRPTGVKRVSPPPSESQTDEPDDTDHRPSGSH